MTQGQTLAVGLVFAPFLMTWMRLFMSILRLRKKVDGSAGYLRGPSGGMSMTHGHTLATGFVDALLTTLMLSFMTVSPRISMAAGG